MKALTVFLVCAVCSVAFVYIRSFTEQSWHYILGWGGGCFSMFALHIVDIVFERNTK